MTTACEKLTSEQEAFAAADKPIASSPTAAATTTSTTQPMTPKASNTTSTSDPTPAPANPRVALFSRFTSSAKVNVAVGKELFQKASAASTKLKGNEFFQKASAVVVTAATAAAEAAAQQQQKSSSNSSSKKTSTPGKVVPLTQASLSPEKTPRTTEESKEGQEQHRDASFDSVDSAKSKSTDNSQAQSSIDGHNHHYNRDDQEDGEEEEEEEEFDDRSASTSSYYATSSNASGSHTSRVAALQWAAASVVDSVQAGYFRGRYNHNNNNNQKHESTNSTQQNISQQASDPSPRFTLRSHSNNASQQHPAPFPGGAANPPTPVMTQTARILSAPQVASHLQQLMSRLQPHEYIMLLGRGMLGVNLKQSYLLGKGVYVDFLVQGGAAHRSGVIYVGDVLLSVADINVVEKGTIMTIPQQIAQAKRPAHLIWITGQPCQIPSEVHPLHVIMALFTLLERQTLQLQQQQRQRQNSAAIQNHSIGRQYPSVTTSALDQHPYHRHPSTPLADREDDVEDEDDDDNNVEDDEQNDGNNIPNENHDSAMQQPLDRDNGGPVENCDDKEESSSLEAEVGGHPSTSSTEEDIREYETLNDNSNKQSTAVLPTSTKDILTIDTTSLEYHQHQIIDNGEVILPTSFLESLPLPTALTTSIPTIEQMCHPLLAPLGLRKALKDYTAQRAPSCDSAVGSIPYLLSMVSSHPSLRWALQQSFLYCVVDGRRLFYLSKFFSELEREIMDATSQQQREQHQMHQQLPPHKSVTMMPHALLLLYTELLQFSELFPLLPHHRRATIATKLAQDYFLPAARLSSTSKELGPPLLMDFHSLVSDSSLRALEARLASLRQLEQPQDGNGKKMDECQMAAVAAEGQPLFHDCMVSALDSLTVQHGYFLDFLLSADSARMRGYLRGTAPFFNLPLANVLEIVSANYDNCNDTISETSASAKHYFYYMLLYLISRTDKEGYGEHDELLAKGEGLRIQGSVTFLTAPLFLRHSVLKVCQAFVASAAVEVDGNGNSKDGIEKEANTLRESVSGSSLARSVIEAWERAWEFYISPTVGALEQIMAELSTSSSSRQEIMHLFRHLQRLLQDQVAAATVSSSAGYSSTNKPDVDFQTVNESAGQIVQLARALCAPALVETLEKFCQELLYHYAIAIHPKFKQHKFHEWMCQEAAQAQAERDAAEEAAAGGDATTMAEKDACPSATRAEPEGSSSNCLLPSLPRGCIKRLMRKIHLPPGLSPHKLPSSSSSSGAQAAANATADFTGPPSICKSEHRWESAECAVVFGTRLSSNGLPLPSMFGHPDHRSNSHSNGNNAQVTSVVRYSAVSVVPPSQLLAKVDGNHQRLDGNSNNEKKSFLDPIEVPPTLESYAVVPPHQRRPFAGYGARDDIIFADGWEISLVNFMVPRANASSDGEDASLYCVSLVFRCQNSACVDIDTTLRKEFVYDDEIATANCDKNINFSTVSMGVDGDGADGCSTVKIRLPIETPKFNQRLSESSWSERIADGISSSSTEPILLGLVLVSQKNSILAMREGLLQLLREFCASSPVNSSGSSSSCLHPSALMDILGNYAHADVEQYSLRCFLEPFLRHGSVPWLERPIGSQREEFELMAGNQLMQSLPPIALALMFVAVLLEQKVVFSSSRRGVLLSASVALMKLLKPLKWCHLFVPRIPAALAADLLQYPAPFILGMPSEDPGIMDLIRDLPSDVTLVDLDVGRVILAPSFAHNSELGRGTPNTVDTTRALRSQVLYLAQSLGGVLGAVTDSSTWLCDRPLVGGSATNSSVKEPFDQLCETCHEFVEEILAGASSCCYWVEEMSTNSEPTILFDENRFFHVKQQRESCGFEPLIAHSTTVSSSLEKESRKLTRSSKLALPLENFDLVLEVFLRCQGMNAFLGTVPREEMAFAL